MLNLQPGTVVNGRYEIVKCLGTGSMGLVYACRHRDLQGHLVAMKVLFAEVAKDPIAAARFRNEIVASYGVNHPNVVRAYEYFRDGDLIAFTMEFVGGGDLADRINMEGHIPISEVTRMLLQMAAGVQAIHRAGIIHRDLKPENILLTSDGDVKITDFGIARTGTGPKLTEHGGVVGTIDYVSPEYLERGQVDHRSDIYAVGVLAYEMITGETPFKGKSVIETMTMRLRSDPPPPDIIRPECPARLSEIVLKAMARDPDVRYQSAGDLLEDLEAYSKNPEQQRPASEGTAEEPPAKPERGADSESRRGTSSIPTEPHVRSVKPLTPREPSSRGVRTSPPNPASQPRIRSMPWAEPGGRVRTPHIHDDVEQLEPLLARPEAKTNSKSQPAIKLAKSGMISVSEGHLSAERIQALSADFQQDEGIFKTILWSVVIAAIGFGVGFLVLNRLMERDVLLPPPLAEGSAAENVVDVP